MTTNIDILAQMWAQAKADEEAAKQKRIDIENKILEVQPAKEEGSQTVTTTSGIKITTTGSLKYKADLASLIELTKTWPEEARPIKHEVKVDESKLKIIRAESPSLWQDLARVVTVEPAKTAVKVVI
jgi:hypothetical protein